MVAVDIDTRDLLKARRAVGHIKNGVPRVIVPAVNRSLAKGQTEVRRGIRNVYLIKQKDIPTKITRATYGSIKGQVLIQQGMLPLDKFRYTGGTGRKQLFAQVKKGGGGYIPRGFVYPGRGPYRRTETSRLPIHRLFTIGAPIMASQPSVGPAVNKAMGEMLATRLDHEIKRVLASAGGK